MAYINKTIQNSSTGQHIRFLQTGKDTKGALLEMEAIFSAHSKEPPAHYHPYQAEDFTVLSGALTIRIDGLLTVLKQGEQLHIPPRKVHAMWNSSGSKTIVNWKVRPAMDTENLLEVVTGLANEGKTNKDGVPHLLHGALVANKYADVYRLSKPPFLVQKILFLILAPLAYLPGYRPTYKRFFDETETQPKGIAE